MLVADSVNMHSFRSRFSTSFWTRSSRAFAFYRKTTPLVHTLLVEYERTYLGSGLALLFLLLGLFFR